jgi:hypothetical protein
VLGGKTKGDLFMKVGLVDQSSEWVEVEYGHMTVCTHVALNFLPTTTMPAILNHASGSANPATSSSALWAYLEPALDHIIKSPVNDPNGKAPAIDFHLYAGIHSACYN